MENNEIYLKIYTEGDNILVLDGSNAPNDDNFQQKYLFEGAQVENSFLGAEHISITPKAKKAFVYVVGNALHTTNCFSYLNIQDLDKNLKRNSEMIRVSYIGPTVTKINIEEAVMDADFFIGCGLDKPKLNLLDKLVLVEV